jgi:hypothetical protein
LPLLLRDPGPFAGREPSRPHPSALLIAEYLKNRPALDLVNTPDETRKRREILVAFNTQLILCAKKDLGITVS